MKKPFLLFKSFVLVIFLLNITTKVQAQAIVLSENFDAFSEGSLSSPTTASVTAFDLYTQTPGWTGEKVAQAGGAVKVGWVGTTGHLTTPSLDLSGNNGKFYISFKSLTYAGDMTTLYIFVNDMLEKMIPDLPNTTAYDLQEYGPFEITGGTADTKIMFSGVSEMKKARFYLDDLVISLDNNTDVPSNEEMNIAIYGSNGELKIKGQHGLPVEVYNLLGNKVVSSILNDDVKVFQLAKNQLYLVKVGNRISKINL